MASLRAKGECVDHAEQYHAERIVFLDQRVAKATAALDAFSKDLGHGGKPLGWLKLTKKAK